MGRRVRNRDCLFKSATEASSQESQGDDDGDDGSMMLEGMFGSMVWVVGPLK